MPSHARGWWRPGANSAEHRVTTWELFFDLVYVFAFTQVTTWIAHEHTVLGAVQGLVVLGLLWLTWVGYAWLGNHLRADAGVMLVGMVVAMTAVFVIGLSLREVWADPGGGAAAVLVAAYAVVRAVHAALYVLAALLDRDAALRRQVLDTSVGAAASVVLLAVGAAVPAGERVWWWTGAVALDGLLTWWLARRLQGWRLRSSGHFAERFALVVILALGESVFSIGVGAVSASVTDVRLLGTAVLGVLLSTAMWWTYFRLDADELERCLAGVEGVARVRVAVGAYTYLHFPLVAGIVVAAAGVEQAVATVGGHGADGAAAVRALLLGTALFCGAIAALHASARGSFALLAALAVLLGLLGLGGFGADRPAAAIGLAALLLTVGAAGVRRDSRPMAARR
ncbi:low temperature requirement protein A [Kocuria sp.]|uniref:low temperature requirement protein A n=1 Tax=Kocuria sp. TaxID=1871328 RepID=UPI002810B68D|nr:low temperature requirement protein A [Kocuria sp.]HST71927.1 low temperature requirement protein A [Kocuria rosea]